MPLFRYEAVAASGELVSGEMEALSQAAVVERLQGQGHVPIRADLARAGIARLVSGALTFHRRRKLNNLALLVQQLATLLHAGLSLDRALEIAANVVGTKAERDVLHGVLDMIRGGRSLADAMAGQNGAFPAFAIGMVRAGEAGGSLDSTLRHLAEFLERSQAAREQVKSALVYPIIVLLTGSASIAVLFGFVIPRFRPLFEESGAALPFAAQAVLAVSDAFRDWWWAMLALAIALGLVLRQQLRHAETRRVIDARILSLPLIGDLIVKLEIGRFCRTLGTLLRNGVAPLTALSITEETLSNTALRQSLAGISDSVKEGKGLAEPLAQTGMVPPLVTHLARVGEETARLDEMLLKIAEIYDQETRRSVDRLLALLVPAVTIGLGIVVALVIGSILTAVLSVYDLAI